MVYRSYEGDHRWPACQSSSGCFTTSFEGEFKIFPVSFVTKLLLRMGEDRHYVQRARVTRSISWALRLVICV